jgi:hypothetical protein
LGRAYNLAGRFEPHFHTVSAEITFRCGVVVRFDVKGVVRTGLHTGLAPNAEVVVKVNDAIGAVEEGYSRANLDTWRVVAVVTPEYCEVTPGVGKFAFFDVLDPCAVNTYRNIMFFLAGYRASVTSYTAILIDDKTVTHSLKGNPRGSGSK